MPASLVRILGGAAKGRALRVPDSARPTPARLRKSLFDLLAQAYEPGSAFLDLYAGAGAVGLEAASRGYDVTLVEHNARAVALLEQNRRDLGVTARVRRGDARRFVQQPPHAYDIVFLDPPYTHDILEATRAALHQDGLVTPEGVLIAQGPVQLELNAHAPGFVLERREYGANALTLFWRTEPG